MEVARRRSLDNRPQVEDTKAVYEGNYYVEEEDPDPPQDLSDPLAVLTTSRCRVEVRRALDTGTPWLSVKVDHGGADADFGANALVLAVSRRSIALLDRLPEAATIVELHCPDSSVVVLTEHGLWCGELPWSADLRELLVTYKNSAGDPLRTDTLNVPPSGPDIELGVPPGAT